MPEKALLVAYMPLDTHSGYGARARDLAHALIKLKEPEFDVKFISCAWGACSFGFLEQEVPEHKLLLDRIVPGGMLPKQPDVFIMCTVPNEFQKQGRLVSIGITAGMESTICQPSWIEGVNRMDVTLVSSEHAKKVFENSTFNQVDNRTKQQVGFLKLASKVEVLFEGLDTNIYKKLDSVEFDLGDIPEEFLFLCAGSWLQGEAFQDRKGISSTIKVFLEAFKNKPKQPALLLKTHGAAPSIMDREEILDKIDSIRKTVKGNLPNIYLLHGNLSDEGINELYNHPKVKALVSLTRGEGYGRPLLEFSVTQKPIIVSGWSGHMDFLYADYCVFVGGQLEKVHPSAVVKDIFNPESTWFTPNFSEAAQAMKGVYENYDSYLVGAKRQAYVSRTEFSMDKMTEKLGQYLDKYIPKMSVPVTIKLPPKKLTIPEEIK